MRQKDCGWEGTLLGLRFLLVYGPHFLEYFDKDLGGDIQNWGRVDL
jgi:hypothetical protein